MHPVSRSLGGRESWNATRRRRDPLREEQASKGAFWAGGTADTHGLDHRVEDGSERPVVPRPPRKGLLSKPKAEVVVAGMVAVRAGQRPERKFGDRSRRGQARLDHASDTSTPLCLLRSRSICSVSLPGGNLPEKERLTALMSVEL